MLSHIERSSSTGNLSCIYFLMHDFWNISPLIYYLVGNTLAQYFPPLYFPLHRDILWFNNLRLVIFYISRMNLLYWIILHFQKCISVVLFVLKLVEHWPHDSKNCELNYKLMTHNVYYMDPLWTWQHLGQLISIGLHPWDIKTLMQSSPTRVHIVLQNASLKCSYNSIFLFTRLFYLLQAWGQMMLYHMLEW